MFGFLFLFFLGQHGYAQEVAPIYKWTEADKGRSSFPYMLVGGDSTKVVSIFKEKRKTVSEAGADEVHVLSGSFLGILDPRCAHFAVVGIEGFAAAVGAHAAQLRALVEHCDLSAQIVSHDGRGQAAEPGTQREDVYF